jgi:DNA-directed RNA polymerase beta subunit
MGGQSLGNWDVYSLLTCDIPHVLQELMTSRSDDFKSKRQMTIDIIENGETSIIEDSGNATTKELYRIHMIALGLSPI